MSQTYAMMLPVLPGKFEDWKTFATQLLSERRREYEASRIKAGIQREQIFHQSTPLGDMIIIVIELEGELQDFLAGMAHPQDDFGKYFLEMAKVYHGIDPDNMQGVGLNPRVFEWSNPTLIERAGETARGISQNLAGTAQELLGKASLAAGEMGQTVAGNANSLAGKAQSLAEEAGQRVQQQAQELKKSFESTTAEMLNKAGDNVAEATQQMQARASEVLEKTAEVGQAVAGKANELLHQTLDKIARKPGDGDDGKKP